MPPRTHAYRICHGKRDRVVFEAKDDSPEAVAAMFAELNAFHAAAKKARAASVTRTAYRKGKSKDA